MKLVGTRCGIKLEKLDLARQAKQRIDWVNNMLEQADAKCGDSRIHMEDYAYHELISIMSVAGKFSDTILEGTFNTLVSAAERGLLRPAVARRCLNMLTKNWPARALALGTKIRYDETSSLPLGRDDEHTLKRFNQILSTEGEDAACSFAAWSGDRKLEWAASKVRAGEWDPNHVPTFSKKPTGFRNETTPNSGKNLKDARRRKQERSARDRKAYDERSKLPRPGEQIGHSRKKK